MIRTHYSKDVKPSSGNVTLAGWAQNIRILGKIAFIKLRDREGLSQVTIPADNKNFETVKSITPESVLAVSGGVKASAQSQNGWELIPIKIEMLSKASVPLPIDFSGKINTSLDKRIDHRYLDVRNPKSLLIFKVLSATEIAMKEYCVEKGFMEINTPKFMASASETGAELFEVKYMNKKAYLAQSPQLYKQMAMASGFDKVFEQAPVFRANPSHTSRHDTEYTSFDVEIAFVDSSEDIMKFEEEWLAYVFKKVKEKYGAEIKEAFGFEIEVPKVPFPRMTMKEALKAVHGLEKADEFGEFDSDGEKKLGEYVKKKFKSDFVFLTEFPYDARSFYIMKKDEKTSFGYDLIYKGLEITSGGQREHHYETLVKQVKEKGLDPNSIKDYGEMFKYGVPPHGGFGLSPTRVVMQMLNLENVREATFLPRDTDRLTP
ncbi:aspartate--tRNA(Asn) ligase [Candidatus Micrarchaeota archaeon]|nr:aspartate--tRNA(Asn) ligase [Candidatus Micrarchaeota archaeon]